MINHTITQEQAAVGEWVRGMAASSPRGWKAFYHSMDWRRKRKAILLRDHGACVLCRARGKYTPADTVHHIKHLKDCPELALTDDNLISLCAPCHEQQHPERNKAASRGFLNAERW